MRQREQERKGLKPTATLEHVEKGVNSYYALTLADDRVLVFDMTPNRLYVTELPASPRWPATCATWA